MELINTLILNTVLWQWSVELIQPKSQETGACNFPVSCQAQEAQVK